LSQDIEEIKAKMWITSRCHMNAERRNRFLEIYFHLLLAFYSVAAIGNSIIGRASGGEISGEIVLYLSILTLSISLIIFGFKFGETAAQHRACYLELQKLMGSSHEEDLNRRFIETIANVPNHSTMDYLRLAIAHPFTRVQNLKLPNGEYYTATRAALVRYAFNRVAVVMVLVIFTLPAWAVTGLNLSRFFL